jgi:hypothetical protein
MPPKKKKKSRSGKKSKRVLLRGAFIRTCIAGGATFILVLLSSIVSQTFSTLLSEASVSPPKATVTIGLEYEKSIEAQVDISRSGEKGYVIVHGDPVQLMKISLPASWHRTEVSGVPLKDVTAEPPLFGFVRWTLPPKATMSMNIPAVPDMLSLETPSPGRATVTINAIDVEAHSIAPQVILLQRKSLVHLWEE